MDSTPRRQESASKPLNPLKDKDYLFLRIYSIDLQTAVQAFLALDGCVDPAARMSIIRDIIVTYGRPFAGNRENEKRRKKHRLDDVLPNIIPEKHKPLHTELKRLRDKLFAHSDLDAYDPKAAMWKLEDGPVFPMSFTALYYEDLNARVPEIRTLIKHVEAAINEELHSRHSAL